MSTFASFATIPKTPWSSMTGVEELMLRLFAGECLNGSFDGAGPSHGSEEGYVFHKAFAQRSLGMSERQSAQNLVVSVSDS